MEQDAKAHMTNRQQKAQDTKLKIYYAALEEIKKKGYSNVTIGDITEAAGVAKGSFYTHFDSKEGILRYTYDLINPLYRNAYEQVKDLDFLEAICTFIKITYTELEKRGKEILKALTTNFFGKEFAGVYTNEEREIYICLNKIITRGKETGRLAPDAPVKEYTVALVSTLTGVENYWCLMEDGQSLAGFAVSVVRLAAIGMMNPLN